MFHVTALIDALAPRSAHEQLALRRRLPQRLLRRSARSNSALRSLAPRLEALHDRLAPDALPPGWWAEPELYPPLVSLGDRCRDEHSAARLLDRLDVIMGRTRVEAPHVDDGWYRLAHLGRGTVQRRGGATLTVRGHHDRADGTRILLPVFGLFSDLPFPSIYDQPHPTDEALEDLALERFRRARALLSRVDPETSADLTHTVNTVALLPPATLPPGAALPQAAWSFNLRLRYPGAIFVNPFQVGVPGVAEGLLHEYLHQRMWLWWELCPPSGLPPWGPALRSPVSGQMRPLVTMLQALVIFRCMAQLHEGLLHDDAELSPSERAWCRERHQRIRVALPELADALDARLEPGTDARAIVEHVRRDLAPPRRAQRVSLSPACRAVP